MKSDPAASPEATQSTDKPIILVVDDSRLMRHAIKKILAEDFTLLEGVDGEDGWEKLLAEPGIQVVFTDLSMPGLDGFGLLQRIRGSEDARVREVPVIVITGNEDDETIKERALQNGATDFITKPFQSVQIRARADAHAKSQRKLQEVTSALEEQATLDPVTQLVNAKHFTQRGNECMSFAVRHKSELAMILLELDGYAALTTDMEESMRDQLLVQVADVLRAQTRREDTVARLDDGRFGLLLPASNPVGTRHLGKRILSEIENMKFFHGGRRVKISVSMGIATPDIKPEMTLEVILKSAVQRLEVALQGGGNCLIKDDKTTAAELQDAVRKVREEELARQRAEEETRQRAEAEAKAKAAEEARVRAEAEARLKAEAARIKAEQEAKARAEEEARVRAEAEARRKAEETARSKAEQEARIKAEEEARLHAEEAVRIEAEQAANAKAAEEARLRAEEEARIQAKEDARIRAEQEALTTAAEEARQRAEEAARIKAEEQARVAAEQEALQRAEMEAIAQAAEEMRLRARQLEVEQAQRKAEVEARLSDASSEVAIVAEAEAEPEAVAPEPDQPDHSAVAEARSRAEQETALIRAETESRRRVAENGEKARVVEEMRRRSSMEAELARVEAELQDATSGASVMGDQLPSEDAPRRFSPVMAVVARGVLPLLEALNRRFKLNWDDKLDTLRKRL